MVLRPFVAPGEFFLFCVLAGALAAAEPDAVLITDLSRCTPRSALGDRAAGGRWHVIPYETVDPGVPRGVLIGAASFVQAPDVTLPLDVSGWHAIYVGFWNPFYAYDDGTAVKVKLSDDPCFTRISEAPPPGDHNATYLHEAFFRSADLTGRNLVFGKVNGPLGQKAYVAYVKLVPLTDQEVASLQADRASTETRRLEGVMDGLSYFWANEYRTREHLLELVEPLRYSDVGKVTWAVCNGDVTNYPSKVGVFYAVPQEVPIGETPNPYIAGEKASLDGLRSYVDRGVIPIDAVGRHVHDIGRKFDIMFRLGIAGGIFNGVLPPMRRMKGVKGFVESHPQFREELADGTPVEKASYAYPEVREFMLSLIAEATERFDVDGVSLGFIRGPQYMQYEKPVLDDFRALFGEDGSKVGFGDPRMRQVRCAYLTQFVRDVRRTLDRVGRKKGKRLEISAWVYPDVGTNLNYGLDVVDWMKSGCLNSVIAQGADATLMAAAKANGCRFLHRVETTGDVRDWISTQQAGVDGFAQWDIDGVRDSPTLWAELSRIGHPAEIEAFAAHPPELPAIRLKSVAGIDVLSGLFDVAYSGG